MELTVLPGRLTVSRIADARGIDPDMPFYFLCRTDEEISLVCRTEDVPAFTLAREDGWRALRVRGILDFSLVGILSGISAVLSGKGIGIFAVSTYNTDYILVKEEDLSRAAAALSEAGYGIS